MKATARSADILRAARVLAPALGRSSDAVYGCQVAAADGRLAFRAISETWDVSVHVPADIARAGTAWIPGPLVRSVPWASLGDAVTVSASPSTATIAGDAGAYTAPLVPPPSVTGLRPGTRTVAELPGADLATLLRLGGAAAVTRADDRTIHVAASPAGVDAYAHDGTWLSRASAPTPAPSGLAFSLPLSAALSASSAAAAEPGVTLLISHDRATLTLRTPSFSLTTRLMAIPTPLPPDAAAVAPHADADARLSPLSLATTLRHALAVAGTDPLAPITLAAAGDRLSLSSAPAHGAVAGYSGRVEARVRRPFEIAVSARTLLRAVAHLAAQDADLLLSRLPSPDRLALAASLGAITFAALVPAVRATVPAGAAP